MNIVQRNVKALIHDTSLNALAGCIQNVLEFLQSNSVISPTQYIPNNITNSLGPRFPVSLLKVGTIVWIRFSLIRAIGLRETRRNGKSSDTPRTRARAVSFQNEFVLLWLPAASGDGGPRPVRITLVRPYIWWWTNRFRRNDRVPAGPAQCFKRFCRSFGSVDYLRRRTFQFPVERSARRLWRIKQTYNARYTFVVHKGPSISVR